MPPFRQSSARSRARKKPCLTHTRDLPDTQRVVIQPRISPQRSGGDRRADPAIEAAHGYLEDDALLRPGETASYFRFWMSCDAYQDISPVQSLIRCIECATI